MHSAGIQAMGVLMDRIILRIPRDDQYIDSIIDALKSIKPNCAWVEGEWEGIGFKWNEIQAVSKHIRMLAEYLLELDYLASKDKK